MLRKLLSALAVPAVAGFFMPGAFAQQATRPATQEELFTYNTMGSINVCYLVSQGIPLKKAFPASMVMIGDVIVRKHGSEIIDNKKTIKLEARQIENGAVIGMIGNIKTICANNFKGEDKKEFDAQFDQIQAALKSGG